MGYHDRGFDGFQNCNLGTGLGECLGGILRFSPV